jgi:hypothetical protein
MKIVHVCSLLLISLMISRLALSQSATGTMVGTARDASGAVLPNVGIRVTNEQTNQSMSVTTDSLGNYTVPLLKPGVYSVAAELSGFRRFLRSGIVLQVEQTARVDISMELGDLSQAVEVTGLAPLLQTENSTVGSVIDDRKIVELPLNGRSFIELALLVPGVARAGGAQGPWALTVDGGRPQNNNFLLDGTQNTDGDFNKAIVNPSVDVIQEFKVQTSNYSGEFGRAGAGQINVVTKSGTNEFHGTVYEFHRNSAFDARSITSPQKLPNFIRHQFGFTTGGPIVKNKTFFFVNYEGVRRVQGQSAINSVPTAPARVGDFSGLPTIYDPDTSRSNPDFNPALPVSPANPRLLRDPFPNNRIPANRIDSITRQVLEFVPMPNLPGETNNYLDTRSARQDDNQYSVRVDHQLRSNNMMFARYSENNGDTFSPGSLPGFGTNFLIRPKNLTISDIHVFRPTLLNEFKFGFARLYESDLHENAFGEDYITELGIPGVGFGGEAARGLPQFSVRNYVAFGDGTFALPRLLRNNTFQWIDNLTWVRGRHTVRTGFEARRFRYNLQAWYQSRGFFQFSEGFTTRTATNDGTGHPMASYLIGLPFFSQRQVGQTLIDTRSTTLAGYVQDDFKVSTRLTLNLGLRYELNTPLADVNHRLPNVDFANLTEGKPTIFIGGQLDYPAGLVFTDKNNWAPRLGFAFRPFASAGTVIRGGYGVFHGADDGNTYFNNVRAVPSIIPHTIQSDNFVPEIFEIGFSTKARLGDPNIITTYGPIDMNLRTGYVQQFGLNMQHQLSGSLLVDIGYVGTIAKKLQRSRPFNNASPGSGSINPRRPFQAFRIADGTQLSSEFEVVSLTIPIGAGQILENSASSAYHGLQALLERRFSQGFTFMTSYTFSKSLTDAPSFRSASQESDTAMDPTNLRLEWGRLGWDSTHRFVTSHVYELPFGPGQKFGAGTAGLVKHLIEGWQLAGIWQLQSGNPFTVSVSGDLANIGAPNNNTNRANLVAGQPADLARDERTTQKWFNTAAFTTPPSFTFGNVGRNTVDGPGLISIDLSVAKNTKLTETAGLQFRAEFFNLPNHPNFSTPGRFVNTPQFGTITGQRIPARQIQFGLKVVF